MHRLFVTTLCTIACYAFFSGTTLIAHAGPITVGPNVHVSTAYPGFMHGEVIVAADPENPNNLVGCSDLFAKSGGTFTIVYSSFDGGAHWKPTLNASYNNTAGDPDCAYGPGGRAYYAVLGNVNNNPFTAVYLSNDAGKTWTHRAMLPETDREYITVDKNKASKFFGRVYLNATRGTQTIDADPTSYSDINGITVFHSIDNGITFSQGLTGSDGPNKYVLGMGNGATLSDGTFAALFGDLKDASTGWNAYPKVSTAALKVITSKDGGEHFNDAAVVSDWDYCNIEKDSDVPTIASDGTAGPFRNRLYAAWPDSRSGRCEVYVAHSDDKGKTWSSPARVNDDAPPADGKERDDFMPVVAVNRNGVVGLMWYDRRKNPDNLGYYVRFSASNDGGDTWTPSVQVSDAAANVFHGSKLPLEGTKAKGQTGAFLNPFQMSGGHTSGMAAGADGVFHLFWVGDHTGIQQLWTARVGVSGSASKYGIASLAKMRNITKDTNLRLTNVVFDKAARTINADLSVINTSKTAIHGPVLLRVTSLNSTLGIPTVTGSINGVSGNGALLNLSTLLDGNALAAGATSRSRHVVFSLSQLQPMHLPNANEGPSAVGNTFIDLRGNLFAHS